MPESRDLAPLRRRADFLRVAAARRKWAAPGLVLQVAPVPEEAGIPDSAIRVGYTASRKVGGAVVRNRARRRLREAVRRVVPAHARPGCDYVVIARGTTPERPFSALVEDLETALKRCKAWRGPGEDLRHA